MKHNKEDIILAIECHKINNCCKCPYEGLPDCIGVLCDSTVEFIKELTEENERLKTPKYFLHEDGSIEKLTNEVVIARMGGRNYGKIHELARAFEMAVRADTVRKMQSEIEKRCIKGGIYPAFVASTIDQVAKEMLEE